MYDTELHVKFEMCPELYYKCSLIGINGILVSYMGLYKDWCNLLFAFVPAAKTYILLFGVIFAGKPLTLSARLGEFTF